MCPAAVLVDLDSVGHVDFLVPHLVRQDSHHSTLAGEGAANLPVDDPRPRESVHELREGLPHRGKELQELAEARNAVVGRKELGEDEAAGCGACEDDAVLCGGPRQGCKRRWRSLDLEIRALHHLLDEARDRDRKRETSLPSVRCDEAQEEQELLLDLHLSRTLVDEVEAFRRAVEGDAEVRTDGRNEPLHLAERLRQSGSGRRRAELTDICLGRDDLDSEVAEDERDHQRGRRVRIADYDAEPPRADRICVERCE